MNHFHRLALAALLLGGCAPKGESSSDGSARDSTAALAMDSTVATTAAPVMTSPAPALMDSATKASATTKAGTTPVKQSGVIGRDSAFGPSFIVDSTGKMVPIPTKKP